MSAYCRSNQTATGPAVVICCCQLALRDGRPLGCHIQPSCRSGYATLDRMAPQSTQLRRGPSSLVSSVGVTPNGSLLGTSCETLRLPIEHAVGIGRPVGYRLVGVLSRAMNTTWPRRNVRTRAAAASSDSHDNS